MKIRKGNYILNSDAHSMWIEEEYETKAGKTATKRVAGYCNDIARLLTDFRNKRVSGSGAESMEELMVVMKGVLDESKELLNTMIENHFRLEKGGDEWTN